MTVTVEAEDLRHAIDKCEDPDEANWFGWDSCENANHEVIHIVEIPNKK